MPQWTSTEPMNRSQNSVKSIPFSWAAQVHRASGKSLPECAGRTVQWRYPESQIVIGVPLLGASLNVGERCHVRHT